MVIKVENHRNTQKSPEKIAENFKEIHKSQSKKSTLLTSKNKQTMFYELFFYTSSNANVFKKVKHDILARFVKIRSSLGSDQTRARALRHTLRMLMHDRQAILFLTQCFHFD